MATRTQIAPSTTAPDALCDEYPCSDGEPMAENDFEYIALTDTVAALRQAYENRTDVYVAGDMFVYYREGDPGSRLASRCLRRIRRARQPFTSFLDCVG